MLPQVFIVPRIVRLLLQYFFMSEVITRILIQPFQNTTERTLACPRFESTVQLIEQTNQPLVLIIDLLNAHAELIIRPHHKGADIRTL